MGGTWGARSASGTEPGNETQQRRDDRRGGRFDRSHLSLPPLAVACFCGDGSPPQFREQTQRANLFGSRADRFQVFEFQRLVRRPVEPLRELGDRRFPLRGRQVRPLLAKTGLFPSQVTALGGIGNNLASACYWHPTWPYKSSLTGITSKQLAAGYTKKSGKQWNQQAGPSLALFDVAVAALKKSGVHPGSVDGATRMSPGSSRAPVGSRMTRPRHG